VSDILTREELLTCLDYWLHDDRVLGPTHAAKILAHDAALREENERLTKALELARGTLARLNDPIRDSANDYGFRQDTLKLIDAALSGKERP